MGATGFFHRFWYLMSYKKPEPLNLSQIKDEEAAIVAANVLIPKHVEFERILAGHNCPPMSLTDLRNYCEQVEHSSENLRFYLTYLEYVRRWNALSGPIQLSSPPIALTPAFKKECVPIKKLPASRDGSASIAPPSWDGVLQPDITVHENDTTPSDYLRHSDCSSISATTTVRDRVPTERPDQSELASKYPIEAAIFETSPEKVAQRRTRNSGHEAETLYPSIALEEEVLADELCQLVHVDKSTHSLPLHKEVKRIIYLFLLPSSPYQINISQSMLLQCLHSLNRSSHPQSLQPVANHIYQLMTNGTLPNFTHYQARNANKPRIVYSLILSCATIAIVLVLTLLDIFDSKPRAMRLIGIPFLWFGIAALLAGLQGSCFILALKHEMQLKPYELLDAAEPNEQAGSRLIPSEAKGSGPQGDKKPNGSSQATARPSLYARIFDTTRTVQGSCRHVQDALLVQCSVKALIITVMIFIVVTLIPNYKH